VRVFRKLSDEEEDELIKRVNRGFKPFDLKMSRLSLVVSNNYLSNSDPEIAHFIL
jgi:hypothetical protein